MTRNLSILLEEVTQRVADAQKRVAESIQQLQLAQQVHGLAQQQLGIWTGALQTLTKEQQDADRANGPLGPEPRPRPILPHTPISQVESDLDDTEEPVSKTDAVLEVIRQHPMGVSAPEIWEQTSSLIKHRPYLYNVLKRLRDREEISFRRNKYWIKPKTEVSEDTVVQ